jgi:hypothetical protein
VILLSEKRESVILKMARSFQFMMTIRDVRQPDKQSAAAQRR